MIPLRDQEYLRERFARELQSRVRIDFFTQKPSPIIVPGREECATCEPAQQLVQELASLSERITLNVRELSDEPEEAKKLRVDMVPAIVIRGAANRPVRFFGIPAGNEFPNLVEFLIEASHQTSALGPDAARTVKKIKDDVDLAVYVTPTCPYCPAVVRAAFRLALASPRVHASGVEVTEFPRLAQRLAVRSVPLTTIDGRPAVTGAVDEAGLAALLLQAVEGKVLTPAGGGPSSSAAADQPAAPPSGLIVPR